MAEGPRKSGRPIKVRQDPDFYYEEQSLKFLTSREVSSESWDKHPSSEGEHTDDSVGGGDGYVPLDTASVWSELHKLPTILSSLESLRSEVEG